MNLLYSWLHRLRKFLVYLHVFYIIRKLDDNLKFLSLLIFPGPKSEKTQGYRCKEWWSGLDDGDHYESTPYIHCGYGDGGSASLILSYYIIIADTFNYVDSRHVIYLYSIKCVLNSWI